MSNIILDGLVLNNKNIYFKRNEKGFRFYNMKYEAGSSERQTISSEENLVFGKTVENKLIAIYCEVEKMELYNQLSLNTDLFIEYREGNYEYEIVPKTFDKIVFCGGCLDSLVSMRKKDSNIVDSSYEPFVIRIPLNFNDLDKLMVISAVNYHRNLNGVSKRKSISFELYLKEEKKVSECMEYIFIIQKMCQFLTFRKNTVFEEIYLGASKDNSTFANVYYDFGNIEDLGKKKEYTCIQIEEIGRAHV